MHRVPLGVFELHQPVARGGMGEVWRGVHPDTGTPVAAKVLTAADALGENARRLFRNEVRAMARLSHPGIVVVLDFGEVDASAARRSDGLLVPGSPYLVMEWASGGVLGGDGRPLPWRVLSGALLELLEALAHAHARGVVHRDLKPGNVLVCTDDDPRPGLKISDFGIAWAADGTEGFDAGTRQYMAPEQLQGAWRDQGPWTDLYALGGLAWRLATGRTPFWRYKGMRMVAAALGEPPPPLEPLAAVPDGFEGWLRALLAKDPHRRVRRAADAAAALRALGDVDAGAPFVAPSAGDPDAEATTPSMARGPTVTERVRDKGAPRLGAPPVPEGWRSATRARPPSRLVGAGLGLYGLREVPLAGREDARERLWEALRDVASSGRPRVVVVRGPAGVGKTALARWLAERAHEVGAATVVEIANEPLAEPLGAVRKGVLGALRCARLDRGDLGERVRDLLDARDASDWPHTDALVELACPKAPAAAEEPGSGAVEERHAVVRALLELLGRERPVVLRVDDAQWGSDALALLDHLLRAPVRERRPVLAIVTARDEALAERPHEASRLEALARHERAAEIALGPLDERERAAFLGSLLGLDPALAARVEERTGGNPLFATQLVGDWVARHLLEIGASGFRLRAGASAPLPDDLHAVWEARVDRLLDGLDPAARGFLERAAALGASVDEEEWHAACEPRLTREGLALRASLVDRLLGARLAEETEAGFAFAHAMLRESVERSSRAAGRWEDHHRACAETLRSRGTAGPHRLGRHLLAAGAANEAVAPLLAAVEQRMATEGTRASMADVALCEEAMDRAGLPTSDARRALLWTLRATVHRDAGEREDATRWAERATSIARKYGHEDALCRALLEQGRTRLAGGDLEAAERLLAKAAARCRRGNPRLLAKVQNERGYLARQRGRFAEGRAMAAEAERVYGELGSERGAAYSWMCQGAIALSSGEPDAALVFYERAIGVLERHGDRRGLSYLLNNMGEVARASGRLDDAERWYRRTAELFEALGTSTAVPELNLALVHLARERLDDARALLEPLMAELTERSERILGAMCAVFLLPCDAARGDWASWDRRILQGWEPLAQMGAVEADLAAVMLQAGRVALAAGDRGRAEEALAVARAQYAALGDRSGISAVDSACRDGVRR